VAQPVKLEDLLVRSRFGSCGVLIRKECFQAVGLFDTELRSSEDRDMWIRIARQFPVSKLRVPLWWYRMHGDNMSYAAARMEENELKVLRKAFNTGPLRWRLFLKGKAFSYASYSAAYMYSAAGMPGRSLYRILKSLLLWPLPYRRSEVRMGLARPKTLVMILLRMLRLAAAEVQPQRV
jgi:hypothetical protein